MKKVKKIISIFLIIIIIATITILSINAYVKASTKNQIIKNSDYSNLQDIDCIIVLGAGVWGENPSPMLEDRLLEGINLYKNKVAPKIIMTGDHGRAEYDEVNVMKKFAIDNGVPAEDVFMDHAGFSTYESLYRAKEIFKADKVIIVTQEYHLYRALYIAKQLGIEAYGVNSDPRQYVGAAYREIREILARNKDFFQCIFKPEPTFLGETIPVFGDGNVTNDKELEDAYNDIINVNDYWSIQTIEYATRGDEIDLTSENIFLKEIAKLNNLEISRQLKLYISEDAKQKAEEYSKFQENLVTYRFNDNREFNVELRFSENEILDVWKENENVVFKDSIIQNEKIHIFEWEIPGDNSQRNCRAQFTVDGMNFIISTYNMSHEEFVKMIKITIGEYKKFKSIENSSLKIEDLVDGSDIVISVDKQRVAYRKNSSSLYIANIDGSNEKLLLKSINNGESSETTGYIPQKFIDNNKLLYTCIGWEDEKGCGIIEIDSGKNDYYENGNNVRYYYDEYEKKVMPSVVE